MMLWQVLLYVTEVKKNGFQRKLGFIKHDIVLLSEYSIKSKIGKGFINEKILEEYYVKIYQMDPYFYENYGDGEKIKADKNEREYIGCRIDAYFSGYNLAVKVDEKEHVDKDLIFEKKTHEALEKKLDCKFIRTNPNEEKYDVFYEIGRIQIFIIEFKNKKLKELE